MQRLSVLSVLVLAVVFCLPEVPCAQMSGYQPSGAHWYQGGPGVYPAPTNPFAPLQDANPASITNPLNQNQYWNMFNPLNAAQPDNPVNPLNSWQPWNPMNPLNSWVPGSASNPLNSSNIFTPFGPVGPVPEE